MLGTQGWQELGVDHRPYGNLCDVILHLHGAADCLRASRSRGLPGRLAKTLVIGHNGQGDLLVMTRAVRPHGLYRVAPQNLGGRLEKAVFIAPDIRALLERGVGMEQVFQPVGTADDATARAEQVMVEDSLAWAMEKHADLIKNPAKQFMAHFNALLETYRSVYDPIFLTPNWPEVLAAKVREMYFAEVPIPAWQTRTSAPAPSLKVKTLAPTPMAAPRAISAPKPVVPTRLN